MDFHKKLFIATILEKTSKYSSITDGPAKTIMKAYVGGAIVGIKKYSQRTVFTVDDGTGTLDCVVWYTEDNTNHSQSQKDLIFGNSSLPSDVKEALAGLNKDKMSNIDQYVHGDFGSFKGKVKVYRGKAELDVLNHDKAADVDYETLWILDILSAHQRGDY